MVRVGDARTEGRWPDHLTAATSQGIAAVLGVPVDLGEDARARSDICSDRPGDVDPDAVETVRHEVVLACRGLRLARHREAAADLAAAMAPRTMTDPAVGSIMGQNR